MMDRIKVLHLFLYRLFYSFLSLSVFQYNLLIDYASELGGVYSAEHGTGKRKRLDFKKCYGEKAVQMIANLKSKLDPDFLLNRGNVISYDH